MRPSMILPLLLFFTPLAIAAQQSTTGHAKSQKALLGRANSQYRMPPDHMACPVGLHADRRASIISREVDGKSIPTGQGLDLHFVNTAQRSVVSADITVHGRAGAVIAQPLTITAANPELSEDFHLTGSASQPLADKLIWTAKIRGITWIELTRVLFSDGTSWQRTIPSECRVEPSLFVLVK
jgi:hypothetical protein